MSAETTLTARPAWRLRADQPRLRSVTEKLCAWAVVVVVGATFVLLGGASLELGDFEARLGMAAAERLGPLGQVYGGWDPSLLPGQVAPSALWSLIDGRIITQGVVRWPAAIASLLIGWLVAGRVMATLGSRAGILWSVCWFGSLAVIDRSVGVAHLLEFVLFPWVRIPSLVNFSPSLGIDMITGLATVCALDRLINRGAGWVAGFWVGVAFLAGGWPPVALVVLALVVVKGRGRLSAIGLWVPPALAVVAWSVWALRTAGAEAWSASLSLPLVARHEWLLAPGVVVVGLPFSLFAGLCLFQSIRDDLRPAGRALVIAWLQVAGACLLVGTIVPGFATASRVPALVGILIAATATIEYVVARPVSIRVRRAFLGVATVSGVLWVAIIARVAVPLAAEVSHYRGLAVALLILAVLVLAFVAAGWAFRDTRRGLLAVALVAVCLKLAHWGFFVPELNYRTGQGAWGRAIGQWVLPRWRIYTFHGWPSSLAFAIGRPIRQLASERHLVYQPGPDPKFVLLLETEYQEWPRSAPPLVFVARFQDSRGGTRILARTEGDASWRRLAAASREE
jgi:hypothetical protein